MLIPLPEIISKYNLNIKNILHLGANTGQERGVYDSMNLDRVIWVEAIPEVYSQLVSNLSAFKKQFAINACIGTIDGERKIFHISNNEAQSSSYLDLGTHKNVHPEVQYVNHIEVICARVDTLMNALNFKIDNSWLLMADLQGAEMDALYSCGSLLNKFGAIYLEVNEQELYQGCALKPEIEQYLFEYGFEPIEELIYKNFGWGDELFVKTTLFNEISKDLTAL